MEARGIHLKAVLFGLGAALGALTLGPAHAHTAGTYRRMTIHAAVTYCHSAHPASKHVVLTGFFRHGPLSHGPDRLNGSLFDSDAVPSNAGLNPRRYNGILLSVRAATRLGENNKLMVAIGRPHSRITVRGALVCPQTAKQLPAIRADTIAVSHVALLGTKAAPHLKTVSRAMLRQQGIVLLPPTGRPHITRSQADKTLRRRYPDFRLLEPPVLAYVKCSMAPLINGHLAWVMSTPPRSGTYQDTAGKTHRVLYQLVFTDARTGKRLAALGSAK